jgi:steroid 5-alpha reductase family enzyme
LQELSIIIIIGLIHGVFYLARRDKILAYMDVAWGLGFVAIALFGYLSEMKTLPKLVLLLMVASWGMRLAYHCYQRIKLNGEDWRYQKLKDQWGENWESEAYKKVFLLQGAAMFFISQPIQLGMTGLWDYFGKNQLLGIFIFLIGFSLETWSDFELKKFKKLNPQKIFTNGPWKICRYPNYLGEIIVWIGFYIYILNFWSAWTIISPILLAYFLIKITGIPLQEERRQANPDYQQYSLKTPRLWPLTMERIKNWKTNSKLEKISR